jgi:hypothetical protein
MFHAFILFGTLDLILPAFLHDTSAVITLSAAAGISTAAFWTLHVPFSAFREKTFLAVFFASIAAASGSAFALRRAFPPVPMHVAHGAVGPSVLPDGRLTMEVERVHHSVVSTLVAVTDVTVPTGRGDRLLHVWRHDARDVYVARGEALAHREMGTMLRLRSALPPESMPASLVGQWTVDVETESGQLVGRVRFAVDP